MKTMRSLLPGQKGRIEKVEIKGGILMRLTELGFMPNEEITCLTESPLGDPKTYYVKGAIYAVRNGDAENIILQ